MAGLASRLADVLRIYAKIGWWGAVHHRLHPGDPALVVHQAVILSEQGVLLSVRSDLRGWELPGGHAGPGEAGEAALRREVLEETGVTVEVERCVGEYRRTGFLPHTARVYRCRPVGGALRPSAETPVVRWYPLDSPPRTLFPWYRGPLADALADLPEPVTRQERQGIGAVLAGAWIDLRMRLSSNRAG